MTSAGPPSPSQPASSNRDQILDQLSYLLDELEAERPWLMRIPQVQIEAKPMDSAPSLLEMYVEMARKEWSVHVSELGGATAPDASMESLSSVIDSIQLGRRNVIEHLQGISSFEWDDSKNRSQEFISRFSFQITQSDGTFLKAIAERLHESVIKFNS